MYVLLACHACTGLVLRAIPTLTHTHTVQAFSELQVKMIENSQRVKIAEGQVAAIKKDIAKSNLTDKELSNLPPGTNTYQAVGRMYVTGRGWCLKRFWVVIERKSISIESL